MKAIVVAILLHEGLHGIPAKDTTLRMHEWPGFVQVRPRPLWKHLLFMSGFRKGGVVRWTGGIIPRDHAGNAQRDIALIKICWS